jgi:hypothetical protein
MDNNSQQSSPSSNQPPAGQQQNQPEQPQSFAAQYTHPYYQPSANQQDTQQGGTVQQPQPPIVQPQQPVQTSPQQQPQTPQPPPQSPQPSPAQQAAPVSNAPTAQPAQTQSSPPPPQTGQQSIPQPGPRPGTQPSSAQPNPVFQGATVQPQSGDIPANPQVIFSWKAPLRAYKKQGKKVIRFYIVLAILLCIIVYFFGDVILIIPILAILFLFYVLTVTPPPIIENKITQFGIETAGVTIRWEVLSHFYYTNRFGFHVLTLVSHGPYYLHSFIIVPRDEIKEVITQILSQHIMFQESPKRTLTDKMIDWLSHLVPDEDEEEEKAEEQKKKENAQATSTLPPRPKWSLFSFLQGLRKQKKTTA